MTTESKDIPIDEQIDNVLNFFEGGIHAKDSDRNGYPTYFDKPYPLWLEDRKRYVKSKLKALFTEHSNKVDRLARLEQMELLRWKYKELNAQSIDYKFLEAYNILTDELSA